MRCDMQWKQFTLLAAAAAILLVSGSAMATRASGTVSPAVVARAPFADPVDLKLCEEETPPLPPPSLHFPCRCPHPTCVLCRSVGDLDFQALTREFGVEGVVVLPNDVHVSPPRETSPR